MEQRNLAREMLERLLRDEIKVRIAAERGSSPKVLGNVIGSHHDRYHSKSLTAMQLIQHLIEFAKELRDEPERATLMGLSADELAFYDALAQSESAVQVLGDVQLRTIARELVKSVRENATIDWNLRAGVRAGIRLRIKKILKKHGYPPDARDSATEQVLEQAELLCQTAA